jgi:hypothetical protein
MVRGFHNFKLDVSTRDGLNDILLEPLVFTNRVGKRYRAPIGSTTDGLSTPKCVRLLPGYDATGDDWWSGVLHDSAFRGFLEELDHRGDWKPAKLSQKQADDLILDAMETQGVGFIRRHIIYAALRLFGHYAYAQDRKDWAGVDDCLHQPHHFRRTK